MYICDRCGTEFPESPYFLTVTAKEYLVEQYVLCENCHQLIKEILQDEGIK